MSKDFEARSLLEILGEFASFFVIFETKFCFMRGATLDLVGDSCYNIHGVLKLSAI